MGNFDDDLKKLADADWIIEAVVENLEIKRVAIERRWTRFASPAP
jgi:3-hydroxyacyl-CoA dehydrogenase